MRAWISLAILSRFNLCNRSIRPTNQLGSNESVNAYFFTAGAEETHDDISFCQLPIFPDGRRSSSDDIGPPTRREIIAVRKN